CQSLAHDYYPDHLWSNDSIIHLNGSIYSADLIHQHALQFIKNNSSHPFFAFLAYTLPHAQLQVPHDSIYQNYLANFHDTLRAAYAAMVTRLDRYVGEMLTEIQTLGLKNNTLIIFSSDNGPHREGGN